MNSKVPFFATIFLLILTLFFLQRSQTSISESNKILKDVKEVLQKVNKKLEEPNVGTPQAPNPDDDPSEKEKYTAMEGNISTEISQNSAGKIDLEKYKAFEGKISTVVIQANSIVPIQNIPTGLPPQKLDLIDLGPYRSSSSGNLVSLDSNQRYIEVNAGPQEVIGDKLYHFKFQVKGIECDCWSDYQDGYLSISVN
ncbi:MAG: hypothetical protein AB8B69_04390 [Chitinophagales bacterium]